MYQEVKGFGKIPMIKDIREYCQNKYGITPGLKVTKDLADDIFRVAGENTVTEFRDAIRAAKSFGYQFSDLENFLNSEF